MAKRRKTHDESDEEDDADYEEIIRSQEPATITQYDDIKITPFNLEEELEEGEFDRAGNFIFRREKEKDEEEDDNWAETIDWSGVEQREREQKAEVQVEQSTPKEKDNPPEIVRDRISCYKEMLRIMKSDETVQKTIRRLGNSVPKRRPQKKSAKESSHSQTEAGADTSSVADARQKLDFMIELAHQRLEEGDIDIYQKSYEDLEDAIN